MKKCAPRVFAVALMIGLTRGAAASAAQDAATRAAADAITRRTIDSIRRDLDQQIAASQTKPPPSGATVPCVAFQCRDARRVDWPGILAELQQARVATQQNAVSGPAEAQPQFQTLRRFFEEEIAKVGREMDNVRQRASGTGQIATPSIVAPAAPIPGTVVPRLVPRPEPGAGAPFVPPAPRVFANPSPAAPIPNAGLKVGRVSEVRGSVTVRRANGEFPFGVGAEVRNGDRLLTGPGGALKITLDDGTTFILGPYADLVIDDFVYDPSGVLVTAVATLTRGVFRFVTGLVPCRPADPTDPSEHRPPPGFIVGREPRCNRKVLIPVGSLGMRGTDFTISYDEDVEIGTTFIDVTSGTVTWSDFVGNVATLNAGESTLVRTALHPPMPDPAIVKAIAMGEPVEAGTRMFVPIDGVVAGVWIDPQKWRLNEMLFTPGVRVFNHVRGDFMATFSGGEETPSLDEVREFALASARFTSPQARLTNAERRVVRGSNVTALTIELPRETGQVDMSGYYYTGAQGNVRSAVNVPRALRGVYDLDIAELLDGLEVVNPASLPAR